MAGSAQEIATAYVSIVPSMRGVQGAVSKAFGGTADIGGRAGRAAGGAFSKTATAAVGAAGVAIGVALTKGLGRLNAIDTAKAKLRGLGNDGEATAAIMKNATAAVKGTSFGLDAAATTAAGAVAAGIKPGKQLESTLKTVANVAAATGRGMDDMGLVFNQVAAGGKAYTQQINQIAYAGLPIWDKLGEVLGKTQDEVRSMVTSGQVDFATFEKAASLAAGTVADEMGKTLPGSLANAGAAVSRIGANLWKGLELDDGTYTGIYGKLAALVQAITNALGPVEDVAGRVGDAVGQKLAPAIDWLTAKFNAIGDLSDGVAGKFGGVLSAVAPLGAAFVALGARGLGPMLTKLLGPLAGLLGPLPKMLGAIGGPAGIAAAALFALTQVDPAAMMSGFDSISAQIPVVFQKITEAVVAFAYKVVPNFVSGIVSNLPVLLRGVSSMVDALASSLVTFLPRIIAAGVQLLTGLTESLVQIIPELVTGLQLVVTQLCASLVEFLPIIIDGALGLFMGLATALVQVVPPLLEGLVTLVSTIVNALVEMLPVLIDGALNLFMGIVTALTEILPPLLESILALLPEIVSSLMSLLPALMDGAIQLFMGIVTALPEIIPPLIDAVIGLIPVIVETLLSVIDALMIGAVQLFTAIVTALPEIIPALIQAFIDLGPVLVQAVTDLIPLLFQAGKDLLGGLVGGIKDMAGGAVDALKEVGGKMLNGIKGFFGIHSPSTVMAGIGGFLDAGLAGGLGKGTASVGAMKATANQITAVTNQLQASMGNTVKVIGSQVNAIISSLQQLVAMMSSAFRNGVTQQLNAVAKIFQTVVPNAARLMAAQTQASLTGLQSWMGTFKNSLVSVLNAIKAAFTAVPSAVVSSWARIKSGTASPTNYVISTVYMNGLRSAVNAIASSTGIGVNMPAVRSVGYASGGVLPGYTPGRDIYDFYSPRFGTLRLGGGEAILRPEVVKALGGAPTINAWNRARGVGISNKGDRGYASGGILDFLNKGSNGWSVNAKHPDFSFSLFDNPKNAISQLVTGPTRDYANRAGGGPVGRAFANSMPAVADALGPSLVRKINALGGGGAGLVAAARKALGVPYVWGGASIPPGLDCSGLVYWAYQQMGKKNVPRLTAAGYQSVATPVSSPRAGDVIFWGNPAHHIAIASSAGQMVHAPKPGDVVRNAAIYGNPTFGRLKYDQGGMLPPGLTLVENRTGKPEPVFTHDQFEGMRVGVRDVYFNVDVSTVQELAEATDAMKTLSLKLKMGG